MADVNADGKIDILAERRRMHGAGFVVVPVGVQHVCRPVGGQQVRQQQHVGLLDGALSFSTTWNSAPTIRAPVRKTSGCGLPCLYS